MAKIRVLPVYPRIPLTFWSYDLVLKLRGKKAMNPPLGLATILAMLPSEKFEAQKIVDMNVRKLKDRDVKNSDVVFVSSMNVQEDSQRDVIDMAHYYGKPVVAGGPFPTSYIERNSKVDFIIAGEAEVTLPPFLEDIVNGTAKKGSVYTPESVKDRVRIPLIENGMPELSNTPVPRLDLIDLNKYPMAALQYSRGCPHGCEFCSVRELNGRIPRTKSPEQMKNELNALYQTGFRGSLFFVDDNLIGNKKNLKKFLPELIKWQEERGYPYSILTQASMDLGWEENKGLLEDKVRAGFNQVFVGIESVDTNIISGMKKKQNLRISPLESVRKMQNAGLEVMGGFIVGFDGEKANVFDNLYSFMQEAGIPVSMVGLLVPIQGTELYKRLEKEGRLREDLSNGSNTHSFSFGFEPRLEDGFTEKSLIKGYKDFLIKAYDDKIYYERCRTLQDYRGPVSGLTKGDFEGIKTFARYLINQFMNGGMSKETREYLWDTFRDNRGYFAQAVGDAMKQAHFKQITRESSKAEDYKPEVNTWYENFVSDAEDIYSRYGENLDKAKELVSKRARKLVAKAERAYHSIHEDFRERANKVLDNLRSKLESYVI